MTYTILPPGPVDPTVRFDLHQWHKPSRAITRNTQLAGSDYINHMHMETHKGHRRLNEFGPVFSNNEKQLRHVIATTVWRSCHGGAPLPAGLENNWQELVRMSGEKVLKMRKGETHRGWKRNILGRYLWNAEQAGGYLYFQVRLLYLSWHLGYTSVEVAQELGTTPPNVRIILWRLCETARRLGYETFPRHKSAKPIEPRRPSPLTKLPPGPQLVEIYDVFGVTFSELAERFGVGRNSVYYAYRKAKKLENPNHEPLRKGPRRWVKLDLTGLN